MNRRFAAAVVLAVAALSLTACGTPSGGHAATSAAPQGSGPAAAGTSAAPGTPAAPTVTPYSVGGRQARLLTDQGGNCIVAIGITVSARVDVTVNAETDNNLALHVCEQMAQDAAPNLPNG